MIPLLVVMFLMMVAVAMFVVSRKLPAIAFVVLSSPYAIGTTTLLWGMSR